MEICNFHEIVAQKTIFPTGESKFEPEEIKHRFFKTHSNPTDLKKVRQWHNICITMFTGSYVFHRHDFQKRCSEI